MQKLSVVIANSSLILFPAGILGVKYLSGAFFSIVFLAGCIQLIASYKTDYHLSKNEKLLFFSVSFLAVTTFVVTYFSGTDLGRGGILVGLPMVIPIYLFYKKNLTNDAYLWYGLVLAAFIGLFVSVYTMYFGVSNIARANGATNAIIFGDLALLIGMLSFTGITFFLINKKQLWWVVLPVMALLSGLIASVLSMSRGGWVAIPFLSLLFFWYFSRHLGINKIIAIFTLIVVVTGASYLIPQTGIQSRVETTTLNIDKYFESAAARGTSIGTRLESWRASWILFKQHPLIGVGWGEYKINTQILVNKGEIHPTAARYVHPHNQFMSSLAKGGIIAIVGTLILFLVPTIIFYRAVKDSNNLEVRALGLAGLVLILSFVIFNMTESFLERTRTVMFFSFYLAVFMAIVLKDRQQENESI